VGLAGGGGLVAGVDSAGAGVPAVLLGAAVPGKVGMVCLRFGASGSTNGPFCPQAQRAPHAYTISPARTKDFIRLSITGQPKGSAGTSLGGGES
jgi:hypothetical protein